MSVEPPHTMTGYDADVLAWSREQAALLRAGRFTELDIAHLADEIEDVGKSEQRELANRMAVLLAHLLKWQNQTALRSRSLELTISEQRSRISRRIQKMPSLAPSLTDPDWIDDAWGDAKQAFEKETGLASPPGKCPWTMADVLRDEWMPAGSMNKPDAFGMTVERIVAGVVRGVPKVLSDGCYRCLGRNRHSV